MINIIIPAAHFTLIAIAVLYNKYKIAGAAGKINIYKCISTFSIRFTALILLSIRLPISTFKSP